MACMVMQEGAGWTHLDAGVDGKPFDVVKGSFQDAPGTMGIFVTTVLLPGFEKATIDRHHCCQKL